MLNNVEYVMVFRVVVDSDGLIKLAKADILKVMLKAWDCLIPQAVYDETVERGIRAAYPDALAIREALQPQTVRRLVRHPRATMLLQRKRSLGQGEQEALHLFFRARADTIISDDAAFVTLLDQAGVSYLPPALVLTELVHQQQLELRAALEGLERMRTLIRPETYRMTRSDLEAFLGRRPKKPSRGGLP
jgi:predicted nucleic acid-binding protein